MKPLLALLALFFLPFIARAAEIKEEPVTHAGVKFRVVRIDPDALRLVWKDEAGQPYRTFDKVQTAFAKQGRTVKFLMNAGIFEPGGIPSGLHIEPPFKELLPLNEKDGEGNFFLKPNGVVSCWIGAEGGPYISTLADWKLHSEIAGRHRDLRAPRFAAQSGPLLLVGGQRHPAFKNGSANKLHRNGVGIDPAGNFLFAITAPGEAVNFWDFAGLFLQLGCQTALFLDGDISQMAVNPPNPIESNQFGAIFVVAE